MGEKQKGTFLQSVYGKVLAAFIISVAAVGAASLISKLGFKDMLHTVESLSAPNEKLRIINPLFYRVTQLEQLQHANAIENPEKSNSGFGPEIRQVMASVDSLRELCQENPRQLQRVDSMAQILSKREQLAASYFALRADLEKNKQLNSKVISLSKKLSTMKPEESLRVVTTTRQKSTTSLLEAKKRKELRKQVAKTDDRSFFMRLFSPNPEKKKLKRGTKQVKEDIHVKVDTIYEGRKFLSFIKTERDLRVVERDFYQKDAELVARELALVKTSYALNGQLLDILKDFEAEELSQVTGDYFTATSVVKSTVARMNTITIVFSIGAALFAFLIAMDFSRGNKLRKALQRAKEEAEHLSQVKQRFLANMSHELRTPLQSILGFSEQVKHQKQPDPEALNAIFYSAEHLLQIVNEVLDYSRIVSGKFTFENKAFEVAKVAREVVATLMPQSGKKDLNLSFEMDKDAARIVSGDAFRLKQVLYNLVGNAIKFTDKGSVSLAVKCSRVGDRALFSFKVKDTGIGIPEKDLSRIFNQFEQSSGNDAQKHGGTGLGLSIAKSLIESQGGMLKVTSKMGEGSVFEMQIPYDLLNQTASIQKEEVQVTDLQFEGEVLVVDDDAIILKLCGAILNKHQIKNTCLNSSVKAAEANWSSGLKIVFTDIQMPGMSGFDLNKALRKKLGNEVKIYALTARALPEEHKDILAQGFDGILMKPFREQELLHILNSQPVKTTLPTLPVTEALPDFDTVFGTLKSICGNDEELLNSTLSLFVTETREDLELLTICITRDLPEQAMEVVHKVAGCVGQLGADKPYRKLKDLEQQLKSLTTLKPIKTDLKYAIAEVEYMITLVNQRTNLQQQAQGSTFLSNRIQSGLN
jgi:signal transduction histidine kinase/HPt (histidine-containing phosphotransfer) domain-containing protein/ActR/RegA family two-component response regulator